MASILWVEVVAGGRGSCRVGTVDNDARRSKQEVIEQLLDERWTWTKSYNIT